jgi:hypothetical protein
MVFHPDSGAYCRTSRYVTSTLALYGKQMSTLISLDGSCKVLPPCNYYSPASRIKAEAYPSSAESDTASLALITSELFVSVPCAKGI